MLVLCFNAKYEHTAGFMLKYEYEYEHTHLYWIYDNLEDAL